MSYEIQSFPVSDADAAEQFVSFRRQLYADSPHGRPAPEVIPPTARLFMVRQAGQIVARAAALVNDQLRYRRQVPGLLGFFEARFERQGAGMLFSAIGDHFRQAGFTTLIGPLNGSTWQAYRVTLPSSRPPFFLDHVNPPYYQELFESNGFAAIGSYLSSRVRLTGTSFSRLERFEPYFRQRGFRLRTFDAGNAVGELKKIHALALESFRHNFLYTPISEENFLAQYRAILPFVKPEFVLLAEKPDGRLAGFLFALDNRFAPEKRELVIKTLAAAPEPACRGIGAFLVETVQRQAFLAGYEAVYHALMHSDNTSARIGKAAAELYHEYRLYGKELTGC
ncbi:GNAT family N-acetyltransferase [Victivallis sp. Marseille-Q1083]|uniref:GNAT family N-acetyltransferase n=1 Tax=Victivallis sp. Marseille-Q1083 TaxID=2717288 RepID=UPI00158E03B9|nr:GNAT family N-acetyltransferase [Victivallis sp. Marseille-Q1083]